VPMQLTARFLFHGSLNDFVRRMKRHTWTPYTFSGKPSVKDSIEAIGVPHLEIREVQVNGEIVTISYGLQPGDEVQVYPYDGREDELLSGIATCRFVLDVHLGTLARSLRMLGFDTVYENTLTDKAIAGIAQAEQRIVLTRDVNLLKHKAIPFGYWLRSQHTEEQLQEVIRRFRMIDHIRPFTRCMVCNGEIAEVPKYVVVDQLPPKTKLYFDEFYQCSSCQRVYWKGSHYEQMLGFINTLR
jgi:uncharacterized protein